MSGPRSYDDACGIARALDAVGERWTLLIVRELVFSAKRFTDLRRGLGGISPNVLTQRLADLERDGIVAHRLAGPPVGAKVYELTDTGRELLPVLDRLARWGSRRPMRSERPLSRDALMLALQTAVRPDVGIDFDIRVTLDGSSWDPVVVNGALEWRQPTGSPAATLTTSSETLHRLVFRGLDLDDALVSGDTGADGSTSRIHAFLQAFESPAKKL